MARRRDGDFSSSEIQDLTMFLIIGGIAWYAIQNPGFLDKFTSSISNAFGSGSGSGGGGSFSGQIGPDGITWMKARGPIETIKQTRKNTNDYRWSGNVSGLKNGAEATFIGTFKGVASGGHFAMKIGGPNHSGGKECCFPAGYRVFTSKGLKPIEEITFGDMVLTHKGRFREVQQLYKHREENEDVYSINVYGSNHEITATHNHPFYTQRGEVFARDLRNDDWIVYPINKTVENIENITISTNNNQELVLPLQQDLLTIIGYYLAEGNIIKNFGVNRGVNFTFSSKGSDDKYIEELEYSLKTLGFKSNKHYRDEYNTCYITVYSIGLSNWLDKEFNHGAKNKIIPQWIIELPNDKTEIILEKYMNGDGYRVKRGKHESRYVKSISENLLYGMRDIALRLGYKTSIRKLKTNSESIILGRRVRINIPYELYLIKQKGNTGKIRIDSDYQYNRIRSIEKKSFNGLVYNIGVVEDNSYIVESYCVSNCWWDHGIRSNGKTQTQTEKPHPSNHDYSPPLKISNVGKSMEGNTIGLKWLLVVEGSKTHHWMWVDTDPITNGKPTNNWKLVFDFVDNYSNLKSGYSPPDEWDCEVRISDTKTVDDHGGLHVRKL